MIDFIRHSASSRETGAISKATSLRISTKIPPSPNITAGPNWGSRSIPAITSTPPVAIGVIKTPSIRADGTAFPTASLIAVKASAAAAGESIPSLTPPASDLWITSGEITFIAAGKPISPASCEASSAEVARRCSRIGIP